MRCQGGCPAGEMWPTLWAPGGAGEIPSPFDDEVGGDEAGVAGEVNGHSVPVMDDDNQAAGAGPAVGLQHHHFRADRNRCLGQLRMDSRQAEGCGASGWLRSADKKEPHSILKKS